MNIVRRARTEFILGLFFFALFFCDIALPATAEISEEAAARVSKMTPPWKLKGPSDWARVYIDSSGSMRGFIGNQAGPHARLLRRLKDILVESQVLNLEAAQFGLKVHPPIKVASYQKYGTERSTYSEGNTYLAGAIDNAIAWNRNGVILVLTDGVSSVTKLHAPTSGPSARRCDLGSDSACLALRIHEYIQKRHVFWIVGLRFPFEGPYWVEEGGQKKVPGAKLDLVKVPDRPFYVWVGAPDLKQGRAIVNGLLRFAQEAKPVVPVMVVEVAPGSWEHWYVPVDTTLEELSLPRREYCARGGALLRNFRALGSGEEFPLMEVATRDKGSFAVRLPLEGTDESEEGGKSALLPLLRFRQELELTLTGGLSRENVSLKSSLQPYEGSRKNRSRSLDLCVTGHPPQGLLGKDIDVAVKWKGGRATKAGTPWDGWSTDTDDTTEAARRTVNLSLFFRHLLSQLIPEFGEGASPVTHPEVLLRIQYRK